MTTIQKRDVAWRLLDVVLSITLLVIVGVEGWNIRTTVSNMSRITAMEADRFTSRDGLEVWKEMAKIREDLATVPREVPPKWFENRVNALEVRLERIEQALKSR